MCIDEDKKRYGEKIRELIKKLDIELLNPDSSPVVALYEILQQVDANFERVNNIPLLDVYCDEFA